MVVFHGIENWHLFPGSSSGSGSSSLIVLLAGYRRKQDEPEKADRCHKGHPQVIGDDRKGNALCREPDGPILPQ